MKTRNDRYCSSCETLKTKSRHGEHVKSQGRIVHWGMHIGGTVKFGLNSRALMLCFDSMCTHAKKVMIHEVSVTIEAECGAGIASAIGNDSDARVVSRNVIPPLGDVLEVYEVLQEGPQPGRRPR